MIILLTFSPAIFPASFVAFLCASPKYAGTVITASTISCPKYSSASFFNFCRIIAEICSGEYSLSPIWVIFFVPINLLMLRIVFFGFAIAPRLAISPTNTSFPLIETTLGVVLLPSVFGIIFARPPSITLTAENVVPRSIPIVLFILF